MKFHKQLVYGTQEFLDELKNALNSDVRFRDLGKGVYTATELIIIKELGIGIWQYTVDGEIKEFALVPRTKLREYEGRAEITYFVEDYNTMIKICEGSESFIEMVIDGSIDVKGDMKKLKRIQAANERMETIMRNLCNRSILLTKEQYIKWLSENGYV
ncbi:MAG: hypothetical protein ACP5NQ_03305 [Vulcanisaeta sp.]